MSRSFTGLPQIALTSSSEAKVAPIGLRERLDAFFLGQLHERLANPLATAYSVLVLFFAKNLIIPMTLAWRAIPMFDSFPKAEVDIVASDGSVRHRTKAIMGNCKKVTFPDATLTILAGDEVRRHLPNGTEEAFEVVDPVYHDRFHSIPAHYQVGVRRKGQFMAGQGGNYHFNVSGANARVNIGSNDKSNNLVTNDDVFSKLKQTVSQISDTNERTRLENLVDDMRGSKNETSSFIGAYQKFVASAANHMTILAPFLPALSQYLGS